MGCASLRRMLAVIVVGGLAVLLAVLPSAGQLGGGGKKARGFGGLGTLPAVVLPEGLNHVPTDAIAFAHIRVADSLGGPVREALLKQLRPDGEHGKLIGQIDKRLGVRLADVESITAFMLDLPSAFAPSPAAGKTAGKRADQPSIDVDDTPAVLVALTYSKAVDRKAVLQALAGRDAAVLPQVSGIFLSRALRAVRQAGPVAQLYGPHARLGSVLDDGGAWGAAGPGGFSARSTRGSLAAALAAGAEPHLIVAGAQIPTLVRTRLRLALRDAKIGAYGDLLPLLNTSIGVTLDVRDVANIAVQFNGSDRLTLEAVQAMRTLAEMALDEKDATLPVALSPAMHKAVRKAVADATIAQVQQPRSVDMRLRVEASPDELARFLAQVVVRLR